MTHKSFASTLALASILVSTTCLGDTWIQNLTLTQVITATDSSGQYVQLSVTQAVSNPGCLNGDTYISRTLPPSTLAIALSAYSLGRPLRIKATGTCDSVLLRPLFTDVGIQ